MPNELSKYNPSTLANADTQRGGAHPSSAELTSRSSPEVQASRPSNSHTGALSPFAPRETKQWYVLRATYGRTQHAEELLRAAGLATYRPTQRVAKDIDGKRKFIDEPLLPNIVFVKATRLQTLAFVKHPSPSATWLKYYTDKTQPVEPATGLHPPIVVTDKDMHNFIRLTSIGNAHILSLPPDRCHFKSGDSVRVKAGAFQGVTGRVARAAGQQRVVVTIPGVCQVATAYIPTAFIEKAE